ncbi:MAG: histidine kinase, partial [Pseudomonadota bacterium]
MSKGFFTFLRSDLAMLVLASMACVVVLTIAIVDGGGNGGIEGLRLSHLLVFAILAGAAGIAGAVVWRAIRYARRIGQKAVEETTILRRNLATTEAIINAEPQLLIFWEKGKGLQVVTHTLTSVPGLPLDAD